MVASNIVLNMGGLPLILTCLHDGYSTRSVIKISLSQTVAFTLFTLGLGTTGTTNNHFTTPHNRLGHGPFLSQLFAYRVQHIIQGSRFRRVS